MASEKAKLAKDRGNAAFKAADYPTAVGHYTEAILADSSDHTFFLNRAAAYLKLGKNEDAERDCTNTLALNANNVKALFRRGQARRGLGRLDDARADLDKAISLEPANESVKNELVELEKVKQVLKQRSKPVAIATPRNTAPKRRRVPIEIIESDSPSNETQTAPSETKDTDLLQPISSRPLKQEKKPTATPAPPPKPQTFADAKQAREESKPVRVSGGIFRHNGNHTIVTRNETAASIPEPTPSPVPRSTTNISLSIKSQTTLFEFTKSWESLQSDVDKWNLIRTIPPSSIPALFQVSLEPELLKSMLHTFQAVLEQEVSDTKDSVRDYLLALAKVQRFGTVMLFMDKQERQLLERLREESELSQSLINDSAQSPGPGVSHRSSASNDSSSFSPRLLRSMDDTITAQNGAPLQPRSQTQSEHSGLVEVFKANLAQAGLYRPATEKDRASHDDVTLTRFLRARRFDLSKAEKQFARAEAWRKQHDVDALFKSFDVAELESSRRFYPRWTGRRDKQGLPVYVYRLASLDASLRQELNAVPSDRRYQRIIALYEYMIHFVLPLCDHLPHEPPTLISSVTTIIDLADVSLATMWSLRSHLQQASTMATANYPETLNTIAVVNSPSFFPTVWNWVKGWFDEGTRRKIHILGSDPGATLRGLIEEEHLPESYGGKLEWVFEDEPCLEDEIQKAIGDVPKGPVTFVDGKIIPPH